MLNLAKTGTVGERLKWYGQKHVLPLFRQCYQPRNEVLREPEACLVSRNEALSESLRLLKNKLPADTDILQEYFVPRGEILPFLDSMAAVLGDNDAKLLNASVRVIHREEIMLNYAREDMFSIVLYLNQEVSPEGNERMATLTADLIDTAIEHRGTFYLPYQLHYTRDQLERAYPEIESFFSLKRLYDPDRLFRNHWYDKYADDAQSLHEPANSAPFSRPVLVELTYPLAEAEAVTSAVFPPGPQSPRGPPTMRTSE